MRLEHEEMTLPHSAQLIIFLKKEKLFVLTGRIPAKIVVPVISSCKPEPCYKALHT
jgi:hypothetical protein